MRKGGIQYWVTILLEVHCTLQLEYDIEFLLLSLYVIKRLSRD